MAIQNDNTVLNKGDLKAYHEKILPYLGGNMMMQTGVSDYYSTDEKIVGIWKDGKPLYQRSFDIGTESSTGMKNYTLNVANVDYAMLDFSHSFLYSKSGSTVTETLPLMIVWDTVSSGGFTLVPQTNSVKLQWYRKAWQNLPAIVTIQYTKTTDTTTTTLTTPGCYDSSRPDLWPANKEVFFGNGLYGFRAIGKFTANISAGSNVWTQIADVNLGLSKAPKTYSSGGWFTFISNGTRSYQAVNQARAGNMNSSTYFATAGTLRFQAISYTNSTMAIVSGTDNYDIWVIYTK